MKRQWRASLLKQAHREIDLLMLHYRAQGNGSQLKYYGGVRRSLQPLYALPSQKPSRYERELSTLRRRKNGSVEACQVAWSTVTAIEGLGDRSIVYVVDIGRLADNLSATDGMMMHHFYSCAMNLPPQVVWR